MNKRAETWFLDELGLSVAVKRSVRAKKLRLKVSALDGGVQLTVPRASSDEFARLFLRDHVDWLRQQLAKAPQECRVVIGARLPIEGEMYTLVSASQRGIQPHNGALHVGGAAATAARRVQGYLKTLAHDRLLAASSDYAERLGRPFSRITLRDTRSRWGSCTSQGALMYSWRLIMAPPEVLRYVAAHEVAHLQHMDHSPAFWACAEGLYGDMRGPRDWLRQNGGALHRYRFD